MKLNKQSMHYFKGARSLEIAPRGANLNIFGDNGTGKTTIADGLFWLLFNKDSHGRADFEIKTLDADGKAIPAIDHTVEAEFEMPDGTLTLCKTYRETYTKKRGAATSEFSGHTTEYFINSVPVQATDYQKRVAEICSEKLFRTLTDPTYFSEQLKWEDRRRILLDICGDVTDSDVIAANAELSELPDLMGSHSLEDWKKILFSTAKKVNEEIGTIPTRIDEANRSLGEAPVGAFETIAEDLKATIAEKNTERAKIAAGGKTAELKVRIREIDADLQGIVNSAKGGMSPEREAALSKQHDLRNAKDEAQRVWNSKAADLQQCETSLRTAQAQYDIAVANFEAEKAKVFAMQESCPTCGQPIPEENIKPARDRFNEARAANLAKLQDAGKQALATLETAKTKLSEAEKAKAAAKVEFEDATEALNNHVVPEDNQVDPTSLPEYSAKVAEKEQVQAELYSLDTHLQNALAAIDLQIADLNRRWQDALSSIEAQKRHKATEKRIEELKAREKELASEYETLQRHLHLAEQFVRAKVSMLTDRINSRFQIARFKLFDEQINGGLSECCEVMVEGVPYGSLNTGSRINAGLDIINVLADHRGFAPVILIDNSESITSLLPTRGQQIRLIVSAADKTLRVETATKAETQGALI